MGSRFDILFGPEQRLMTFVMNEILCATESIDIEVYLITSKRIANRIVKAHEKGVNIRMIVDGKPARRSGGLAKKRYSRHKFLMKKGIEVRPLRVWHGAMHNKFIIIDQKMVIAGSPNLSNNANYRNHEFIIVSEDRKLVRSFGHRFDKMWGMAGVRHKQTNAHNPPVLPTRTGG